VVNVASGAAVRLSDSGLGCPDWPTCSQRRLTPPLALHPVIEFTNRMVVTILVVACAITAIAAFTRRPVRRDLRWLSAGLVLGVFAEAGIGAVVVYSKLNAYVVMTHFLVGMALLTVGVVLTLRAGHGPGRGVVRVSSRPLTMTRVYLGMLAVAIAAGTATTGAGPHAGGVGAKRVPIGLSAMTRIHAEIVLATGVLLLALLWELWHSDAPARIQESGRVLLAAMVAQGLIGYTQYFTHLPALLVGVHVLGANLVWSTALWFHHGLSDHRPEVPEQTGTRTDGSVDAGAGVRAAVAGTAPVPEPA